MRSKKFFRGLLVLFVLLVIALIAFVVWGLPKSMGSIEPLLNFKDVFRGGDGEMPGKPAYYQFGPDCNTGDLVKPGELIQPEMGCDDWRLNRYERPFNAFSQDQYFPDLDIQYAYFGRDANWYYLRLALFGPKPGTEFLPGTYAMEMDLDTDGRGDLLVLVSEPGKEAGEEWSTHGVQIWVDTNNDVGGEKPNIPEVGVVADGYDTLVYDQGSGDHPNGAWARAFMTGSAYVELAFRRDYLRGDIAFKWWVWSGHEKYPPGLFELHDFFPHERVGDTNKGMKFFPIKEIFAVDSSCAFMWGTRPDPDDPDFCFGEVEPPDDTCKCLKCLINLFPCRFPRDIPGAAPCVLPYEDWVILVWQPEHPGETPDNAEKLWHEYEEYLKDPYCPPFGTKPPPDETKPPGQVTTEPPDGTKPPVETKEITEAPVTPPPTEEYERPCDFDCDCEPDQGETEYNCPNDCAKRCGNGVCDCDEDPCTCSKDCGKPDSDDPCCECGDGKCIAACGEDRSTCSEDCGLP